MTRKLYMMRHGETLFNTQKRVQGWSDSPLTELGIAQAEAAGRYFRERGISFEAVYSSTQERAVDTAKLVAQTDQVCQLKGIKEMNFGSFEAQPEHLLPKSHPGAKSFEDLLVPYGGEDLREVGKRVKASMDDVLANTSAQTILMVSHGAAMWGLVQYAIEEAFPMGIYFSNCSICEFALEGARLVLKAVINPLTGDVVTI
ncbi:histidine phosphatase family protein [Streptococcus ovuberis]|nr:histidine phosphatase family protein [Streptococcus ovuberis]